MSAKKDKPSLLSQAGSPAGKHHQPADVALPDDWFPGQSLLDDFLVERELGEGGMGKVYLLSSRTTGMRFAVKRAKGLSESVRRDFLAELQTWIDLPEHENLVPCRFFRTVGDEVLIFAEYVEGGSLRDWIESGRLYEGADAQALVRVLDTAIQFAWGLHCVHELGLVHQDVKPANVMVSEDGQVAMRGLKVRVTDYGLARARAAIGAEYEPGKGQSILVSGKGHTPAYCSPEQAAGRKLDRRTDMWSWGVSVLEMFMGEVTWHSGTVAAKVLDSYLSDSSSSHQQSAITDQQFPIPSMPKDVVEVLKGCFQLDPEQRWKNMEVVVQRLLDVYDRAANAPYHLTLSMIERRTAPQAGTGVRRTREGGEWGDPRKWLEWALRADGRDPAEAADMIAQHASSRRGQLVADIATYDEARRICERLIEQGRKDLEKDLASLCENAALVHETAGDSPGALALYDRAIEIREQLINVEGRRDLADYLASVYIGKANAVSALGDERAAVELYDRAIEIRERLVNVEGRRELASDLASVYMNKANAVSALGDKRAAVEICDRAIEIRERLVNVEGRRELADDLATVYSNKAVAVSALGDQRAAVELYDRAIVIRERLVNVEGRREHANMLAEVYSNKAAALSGLGDERAAVALYDRAIEIREQLVNVEGRRELANDLATVYLNKAVAVSDKRAAVELYDRAIEIREQLVNVEGRRELANDLALVYMNKAVAVSVLGDNRAAVSLYDGAIEIRERLVNVEGRRELADDLAMVYLNKAVAVSALGDQRAAVEIYDRAIVIRERLVNVEGRRELANDLALVYMNKAIAVSALGDKRAAVELYDQAIEILERLVNVEGRRELANNLATVYLNKAIAVSNLGDKRAAVNLYDQAIALREYLVNVEGRRELTGDLARVKAYRGMDLIELGDTDKGTREAHEAMAMLRAEIKRTGREDLKGVLEWTEKRLGGK